MSKILVIDDDRSVNHLITKSLETLNKEIVTTMTADQGLQAISPEVDVVLLDIMLPGVSGLDIFRTIQKIDRRLPVIFMTAGAGSETAIEAMRLGAYDYVSKPLDLPKLKVIVQKALETRRLMSVPVAVSIKDKTDDAEGSDFFIGKSPQMLDVFKSIGQVANQNITVLIRGESGTGKELVARSLYQFSNRSDGPFMAINCAALSETLLDSELFGHEKGSFTSADRRRIGKFEQCSGGTLFLDEVGDMPPLVQGKVLRLLQEQKFERLGGNETITTDVRLIAATNRPLEEMVETGKFRKDLFYRLNVVTVNLPPLRDRKSDIPLLLEYSLGKACKELNKSQIEGISPDALEILCNYPWPGNIRELESIVRQSVIRATGPVIVPEFLPENIRLSNSLNMKVSAGDIKHEPHTNGFADHSHLYSANSPANHGTVSDNQHRPESLPERLVLQEFIDNQLSAGTQNLYAETLEKMERILITRVLQFTGGNQSKAAEILGITRGKIRDRIATFRISLDKNVSIESNV